MRNKRKERLTHLGLHYGTLITSYKSTPGYGLYKVVNLNDEDVDAEDVETGVISKIDYEDVNLLTQSDAGQYLIYSDVDDISGISLANNPGRIGKVIIYIDMDGVIADFTTGISTHPDRLIPPYDVHPDQIPGIFRNLQMIQGAKKSVTSLLNDEKYEVYFLSTAPWNNPSAWTDKRLWLEDQFGESIEKRLIITHRKDLLTGDVLIDDRPNNGADEFTGEWIQFGSEKFPNWEKVLDFVMKIK